MRTLIEELCSAECAGRRVGTPGGIRARGLVQNALREAGLDPDEQAIARTNGANVLATIPGASDRWVLVAAHYDHLGESHRGMFAGADDNAAAVGILVEVARGLAKNRPDGRGVIVAAFDAEEPPHFLTQQMGSAFFAEHPSVPLESIDLMVCMDLVGHAVGARALPGSVRNSVFALGAEKSDGVSAVVDELAESEPGVVVRRLDATVIPPLSDYEAFWRKRVPFLFLTSGRSARYHTPEDTPEHLDYAKIDATARWLERFVRASCEGPQGRIAYRERRDDRATLQSVLGILAPLAAKSYAAEQGKREAEKLLRECDADGALPGPLISEPAVLVSMLESALG